jgi:hypothetical protein
MKPERENAFAIDTTATEAAVRVGHRERYSTTTEYEQGIDRMYAAREARRQMARPGGPGQPQSRRLPPPLDDAVALKRRHVAQRAR